MGGLFYTGQSRRTSGSFTVTCSGAEDIVKRLNKLENGGQTAIKKTVNDFMSRNSRYRCEKQRDADGQLRAG